MGGLVTGLLGGLGGNSQAQQAQQAELAAARQAIQAYRPEAMQARLNGFSAASSAYQPANNALQTLYGGRPEPRTPQQMLTSTGGMKRAMGHELPQQMPSQAPQSAPTQSRYLWEDPLWNVLNPGKLL